MQLSQNIASPKYLGTERYVIFDSEIIKNFSYPMPLKELQLELF